MPEKKTIDVTPQQLLETYRNDQTKLNTIQRRQQALQQVLGEMIVASETLKEIQKAKKDENILVSLGAGVYAEAKVTETKTVKSSLSGSVLVNKSAATVVSSLQEEIKRAQKDLVALQSEGQKTARNLQNIASILEAGRDAVKKAKSGENSEAHSVS